LTAILLDTHAWAWTLNDDPRLSAAAAEAIGAASAVHVSPISFYEIGQKARIGKWPEIVDLVEALPRLLAEQGGFAATMNAEICLAAATSDWPHRDPFDRLIAATAAAERMPLVSADAAFDSHPQAGGALHRLW
jgi:PIN domain nuclease of toxin-antitoxin system